MSSLKDKILIDGIAIAIRTNTGKVVHNDSNKCPCSKNRSVLLFITMNVIMKKKLLV